MVRWMANIRLFFSVDVHGNTELWNKWMNAAEKYKTSVIILAGDLTGKAIIPIFDMKDHYEAEIRGKKRVARGKEELEDLKRFIEGYGYYYVVLTPEEADELAKDEAKVDALFKQLISERMRKWLDILIQKVDLSSTMAIVMPGNDDEFYIDDIIREYEDRGILYPLDKVIELEHGYQVVSLDYVNPTPWSTPREVPDKKLAKIIQEKMEMVTGDRSKVIFNFHPPPYNTKIDLAPKLDKNLRPVYIGGAPEMVHVGSTSVRKAIEEHQPILGLHGHIHESSGVDKIGNTLVMNPGSEYSEGVLRAYLIELDQDGIVDWWRIEG